MVSKNNDYRLIAGVFRKIYLDKGNIVYQDSKSLYREIIWEMMRMLKKDNPFFNPDYFLNFIVWGTEKPQCPTVAADAPEVYLDGRAWRSRRPKSPSGEAEA